MNELELGSHLRGQERELPPQILIIARARTPAHSMLWICISRLRGSWCSRGPRRSTSASARMNAAISARVRSSPSCRAALLDDEWSIICRRLLVLVRGGPASVKRDGRCGG